MGRMLCALLLAGCGSAWAAPEALVGASVEMGIGVSQTQSAALSAYQSSYQSAAQTVGQSVSLGPVSAAGLGIGGAGGAGGAGGKATSTATGGGGGNAIAGGGSASAGSSVSAVQVTTRAAAYAPDVLATPTAPCRVAIGASAGWLGGALGLSGSVLDEGCHIRETARVLAGLGLAEAAVRALCQDGVARKALGALCPSAD